MLDKWRRCVFAEGDIVFARPCVDKGPILGIAGMKSWAFQRCTVNPEYGAAGYSGYDIAFSKNVSAASKIEIGYDVDLESLPQDLADFQMPAMAQPQD
jgi:hypothetical protein